MTSPPQDHPYPAHEERDVVLRSGATARLRPIRPADAPALLRFYKGLSPNSLYFRFFSVPTIDAEKTDDFCRIDYENVMALVCEAGGTIVAIAQYFRFPKHPERAEVAFTVDDALQGQGIGTRLLERLAEIAREHGITSFEAEVLGDNRRMLDVFAQLRVRDDRAPHRRGCREGRPDARSDPSLRAPRGRAVGEGRFRFDEAPLRAARRGRDRRGAGARKDRRRDLPQPRVDRLPRKSDSDQPERGKGARRPRLRAPRRRPRGSGPRRHRDSRGKGRGRRGRVRGEGRQGDRGDHRGLFRNGGRGPPPRGRAARKGTPLRNADGGPQLHGPPEHGPEGLAEHDLLAGLSPGRERGAVVSERRARPRAARARVAAEPGDLELRVRWQQGGRIRQRPDPVLVGRPAHGRHPSVPRELREPGPLLAHRAPRRPHETDRRREERPVRRRRPRGLLAHRRPGAVGHRRGRALSPGGRHPDAHARRALRRGRSSFAPADTAGPACRDPDECGRPRHSRGGRLRGPGPVSASALGGDGEEACGRSCPPRRAWRIRST